MKLSKDELSVIRKEETEQLKMAICKIKKPEEAGYFIRDLLTYAEHRELSRRLEIASLLKSGFTQQEISYLLGVGVATVSRVNAKLNSGLGFKNILSKLPKRKQKTIKLGQISNPAKWFIEWRNEYIK